MNHPYYRDLHEKFGQKKILANQQDAIQRHLACLREQAVIVGVVMGIVSIALILVAWSAESDLTTRLILTAIGIAFLLVPLCPAAIYWRGKKKYAYTMDIASPNTLPNRMRCVKVKIWLPVGIFPLVLWGYGSFPTRERNISISIPALAETKRICWASLPTTR